MSFLRNILIVLIFATAMFQTAASKDFVIVIDPGHGGKDVGAKGVRAYEKNINLSVSKKLGQLIKDDMKDVKVVYTRNDDYFVSLKERCNIANKAEGDLFISIHTNSLAKKARNRKTIKGASTYTLGLHRSEDNLEVAIRENSVIELEKDYSTIYKGFDPNSTESYIIFEMSQSKHMDQSIELASLIQDQFVKVARRVDKGVRQAGFWVLANTGMPAVLIELDFICNPTVEQFLSSKSGQEKMAKSIFNAIKQYRKALASNITSERAPVVTSESENDNDKANGNKKNVKISETVDANNELDYGYSIRKDKHGDNGAEIVKNRIYYKVQFLTSEKPLAKNSSFFKGLKPVDSYKDNGLYKYTYGLTDNENEAYRILKDVRKKFKEAFIVKFKNGKRL